MSTHTFAAIRGTGVLAVWNDIPEDMEVEYNNWYTNQHLPERVGIEGFLRGRRFRRISADGGGQKYFTLYETESTATLRSEPYIERLNDPTDWTKKVAPAFVNSIRTVCSVTTSVGKGTGGLATTVEFGARAGEEAQLRTWLSEDVLPTLVQDADIIAAHLFESDLEITSAKDSTAEQSAMAARPTDTVRWFVLVESMTEESAGTALKALAADALVQHGADDGVRSGTFRLLVGLDH